MARKVWVPTVSGPLAPYAAGFASWLASRAYSPWAAADRLYQFDQLSRWLERGELGVGELTGKQAERLPIIVGICQSSARSPITRYWMRMGRPRACSFADGRARTGWGWSGCPRRT